MTLLIDTPLRATPSSRVAIEESLCGLPQLRVLTILLARLRSADADVSEIAAWVKRDPGLSGVLLNAANSAAFCGCEPVTCVEDAVARLGYREIYRVIGDVASVRLGGHRPLFLHGISARRLRENSLFCARVLEDIAEQLGIDPGMAYTMGLLRSLGKGVLQRVSGPDTTPFRSDWHSLLDWEVHHWSMTSHEVTARAFELWLFPSEVVRAMREYLSPDEDTPPEGRALHLAAYLAENQRLGLPGEAEYLNDESVRRLGLDPAFIAWAAEIAAPYSAFGSSVDRPGRELILA